MGYLGRRIGLSQDRGDSTPGGAGGAVGGGLLDLFAHGYFERQGDLYNAPGVSATGLTATGGVISDYPDGGSNIYRAHIFTSSGTFNVTALGDFPSAVDYLVVAGGGGGGCRGGGGGAGGLRATTDQTGGGGSLESVVPVAVAPYAVVIGAGGDGSVAISAKGVNGVNSSLAYNGGTITSTGGGGGGSDTSQPGSPGASGGGGSNGGSKGNGLDGSPAQGFNGADASGDANGGGGGAGAVAPPNGNGGPGVQVAIAGPTAFTGVGALNPSTSQYQWFAGGGGRGHGLNGTSGTGGIGGGGDGVTLKPNGPGKSGASGTGGGGGGGGADSSYVANYGGSGGSGIVIVRYQIAAVSTAKASGGSVSFYNSGSGLKTIHTFTSSGNFITPGTFDENVEYLVVGGGGAGGGISFRGGGGGAGAVIHGTTPISSPQTIAVQVGGGGHGLYSYGINPGPGGNGTNSFFGPPITAPGGGMGGGYVSPTSGIAGGSGGGASGGPGSGTGGNGTGDPFPGDPADNSPANGWGHDGGATVDLQQGGGGGGAGAVGYVNNPPAGNNRGLGGSGIQVPATFRNPVSNPSGTGGGGLGVQNPTGTSWYIAGGGNGGGYSKPTGGNPYAATVVPAGGGGTGAIDGPGNSPEATYPVYRHGHPGVVNTGSGGGGSNPTYDGKPGSGASGLVLIAYPS